MGRSLDVSWDLLLEKLEPFDQPNTKVYGVPNGGMLATAFLRKATAVYEPSVADLILDDIIDSGKTRTWYQNRYPMIPFDALFKSTPDDPWLVFPWERNRPNPETGPEDAVRRLLQHIGEDVEREGLIDTPGRVCKALAEMTEGYGDDPSRHMRTFSEQYDELVVVRDIPFKSLCEHHMLPFTGTVTVGYLPNGKVIGLSKIPRIVHTFAKRLQIQERLTSQIAQALIAGLKPHFVGVLMTSHHTCMSLRGVESHGNMVTSALLGRKRDALKEEFLRLANG